MSWETWRSSTNDHRYVKARHPVRSAIYKHVIAGLVLRWVTTWESPVLFVLLFAREGRWTAESPRTRRNPSFLHAGRRPPAIFMYQRAFHGRGIRKR